LYWISDYNFGIKCGGPQITSSDGIVYERDNETLGPATYYVTNEERWAVSNVGYFTGSNSPQYISTSPSQFTSIDSELFQTTRLSASSLRYYGLGLENGNYTVRLQFVEIAFPDDSTWQSLGRRVFDIYIQVLIILLNCFRIKLLSFEIIFHYLLSSFNPIYIIFLSISINFLFFMISDKYWYNKIVINSSENLLVECQL
jgi:hypothetical protein